MNILTPRQIEFLVLAANGLTSEEIAKECYVSPVTVHKTMRTARDRLETRTTGQAIVRAVAYELIVIDHEGFATARESDKAVASTSLAV